MRADLNTSIREQLMPGSAETPRTPKQLTCGQYAGDDVPVLEGGIAGSLLRS